MVARRGLGADEVERMTPAFAALVRWALIVEKGYEPVPELERVAAMDPPDGLSGSSLVDFRGNRGKARDALLAIRSWLLLERPEPELPEVLRGG